MRAVLLFALAALPLRGQLAFEAAAIHPSAPQPMGRTSIHRSTDTGRLTFSNVSLMDLVGDAFRVPHRQISGPEWLDSIRYDIAAKFPAGATEKQVPEMLRSLLVERFGFKQHEETKELPVYALVAAKSGPRLKAIEYDGSSIDSNGNNLRTHVTAKTDMAKFAEFLSQRLDRPVIDETGLAGAYGFELEFANENAQDSDAASIFTALQEQLGLRLAASKGPVRIVVVDKIDKTPAEN